MVVVVVDRWRRLDWSRMEESREASLAVVQPVEGVLVVEKERVLRGVWFRDRDWLRDWELEADCCCFLLLTIHDSVRLDPPLLWFWEEKSARLSLP